MKKRQNALVAVTAAAALFTLTACGGGGTATTTEGAEFSEEYSGTLTAWGFQEPDEVAQSRIDLADAKLAESDTTVDLDNSPFDAQKFTTLAASGNIPDVVLMDRQFVTTYASQGLIMPIDDCFSLYDIDPREYWYPQVVDDVTWDDQVFAVPQFYQPPAIILNMRVMEQTGVTPEEMNVSDQDAFLAAVEKMTVMDGQNPTRLGFDPQGPSKAGLWMLSFGGSTIGDDGEPTLDNPKNAEAIEFLKKIYDLQGGYANAKSFVDSFDVFGENNSYVADQVGAAIFDQWYVNVLTSYADQVQIGGTPVMNAGG